MEATKKRSLVKLLHSSENERIRWLASYSLGKIAPVGNKKAIKARVQVLDSSEDEGTILRVAESLGKINPGNKKAIKARVHILYYSDNMDRRFDALYDLGEIAPLGNKEAIAALVKGVHYDDEDLRFSAAYNLIKIEPGNKDAIAVLAQQLFNSERSDYWEAVDTLEEIAVGNKEMIAGIVQVLHSSENRYTSERAANVLKQILQDKSSFLDTVRGLKDSHKLDENKDEVLWHCAQNLSYPDFHEAFNDRPVVPASLQQAQIASILAQLQPTDKTYPLPLDAESLAEETDPQAIPQEFCNLIYLATCPSEDIPENIDSAAKLKPKIQRIKKGLPKPQLAIILYNCEPSDELIKFCRQLRNMLHIGWVTEAQLEPPLRGFPANQADLLSAMRSWLQEIG
ncbi:MAG: HEAT repeat domain-containing protein [Hormoscilla sp. GUM202]|nr:HEAT repeat domain-containing protein [Hormoscilla sp. GUM202]